MFGKRKKERSVDESNVAEEIVEEELMSFEELEEEYDRNTEIILSRRSGWRTRVFKIPFKWSVSLMLIGTLLISVLAVLFMWSGYKDVTDRLDTIPRVELSDDGFAYFGSESGSGTFNFEIDFGVKEMSVPIYVGKGYETEFEKDRFSMYARDYTVYVKLYGDAYELYTVDKSKLEKRTYSNDDLKKLTDGIEDRGVFIVTTMLLVLFVGKLFLTAVGGFVIGSVVYGLTALGGRAKYVTYRDAVRVGFAISMLLLYVEMVILMLPMMYGPWLVMRVMWGLGTVMTALVVMYKAETGVVLKAIEIGRVELKSKYWEYTREFELAKMETLKEEKLRKEIEKREEKATLLSKTDDTLDSDRES